MKTLVDNKIKNIIFFLICFTLIFNNMPKPIQMNFIGGPVGNKLVFYPLFAGFVYTAYWQWKYKNVFVHLDKLLKFLAVYLGVTLLSLLLGLYNYPYWELIICGPVDQIEKLPKIMSFLETLNMVIDSKILISIWMVVRTIKGVFFEALYTFGGAYMIFCWYKDDLRSALRTLSKAILFSLIIIFSYCAIEVCYLIGSITAKNILEIITPYIHCVRFNNTWWPPLLWKGQLRSVFAEPSYFGMYSAFCLPFLWLLIVKNKFSSKNTFAIIIITTIMTILLILSKARTGFMLHIGQIVVLELLLLYIGNKHYLKKSSLVLLCSIVAFTSGNLFISEYMTPKKVVNSKPILKVVDSKPILKVVDNKVSKAMKNYVSSNAASIANPDARSNRARYSVMEADIKVGLDKPVLGVGSGLRSAYVMDAFSDNALKDSEVKYWIRNSERLGLLKFGIPKLGEYTSRFCETGILGLLVFLFPAVYLVFSMLCKLKKLAKDEQICYVMFLTSFAGILASGIGDTINITYCYWVLLGVGYAMCFGKREENVDNE